ncbi:hypothetical protein [Hymenobacter swuensis]|uniref:Uncharacterized protein n=1 Tax=Hymenobacter swuensis DY53 TaxID=1227739 RepID=W8EYX1_9BACT|nr:hypothetical protein [Hymenobacter swuensis]AHJ95536.1 hypothetical protein Hsw_PA0203 [Hymenobacter swuensis DY53]
MATRPTLIRQLQLVPAPPPRLRCYPSMPLVQPLHADAAGVLHLLLGDDARNRE